MGPLKTLAIATKALAKNKMRAALTVLGVVIGIAAVTTMVSIGQSASALVQGELESFGTNVMIIFPGESKKGGVRSGRVNTLTSDDARAISDECSLIQASSPLVGTGGQVVYGNLNISPNEMFGVGPDYLKVRNWPVEYGSFFDQSQIDKADKVCVIGHTLVNKLFQTSDPLDQTVRINNKPFRVVGILEKKGANMMGEDQDSVILMPYTSVRRTLNGSSFDDVHVVFASAKSSAQVEAAKAEVTQLLLDRHSIDKEVDADFDIKTTNEIADMLGMITGTMTLMLASIAGISLLVGGVGIMNIMLVSVTERTREIGIRMAVGARSRDILMQFLVESILLSCVGGLIGFALGISASIGITTLINSFSTGTDWPIIVSIPAAIVAFLFAAAVGAFFGFYPARRASKLDPIDALRYE
ncbi:ABC transporter permease [Mariniblastus fucicola]|uniref:Macrolide export ATP-binding/permease protein MacB n=1 Tax=Mariniblastus fucicola TaxID=980251 RepID=A0A5B9P7V5_9BACT|nr:ABC transporter permease [Mariniblastus fucicola]QEG20686.1 Macrolide export ATP-binding/permease protein MacB [Mariniblastus fucicola]